MKSPTDEGTLYSRIGGYDVMAAIVDEFLTTLSREPQMSRFSTSSLESRRRNRQLTLDYLCDAAGGPTFYLGKDMKTAHAGLGISASEWQLSLDHVAKALTKFKVPEREAKDLMTLFSDLGSQIVEG